MRLLGLLFEQQEKFVLRVLVAERAHHVVGMVRLHSVISLLRSVS
ncbi:MAG: hypothetical protein ACT4NP_02205 [Pseudonocardiales bacterium]